MFSGLSRYLYVALWLFSQYFVDSLAKLYLRMHSKNQMQTAQGNPTYMWKDLSLRIYNIVIIFTHYRLNLISVLEYLEAGATLIARYTLFSLFERYELSYKSFRIFVRYNKVVKL